MHAAHARAAYADVAMWRVCLQRRKVRSVIKHETWGDSEIRLTPEKQGRMGVRQYLMALGQHRFVLSPRGNGLDAHRTWEALLVGAIPSARRHPHTALCTHTPSHPLLALAVSCAIISPQPAL